jgi:hypothetical protein
MTTDEVLTHFEHRHRVSNGWSAQCPVEGHTHDDRNPSLSITNSGDRTLVNCFTGHSPEEIVAAIGLKMSDLFDKPKTNGHRPKRQSLKGCTLMQLSEHTKLPIEFLRDCGLEDCEWFGGVNAVKTPYRDERGQEKTWSYRVGVTGSGKDKFRRKTGHKLMLLGLDALNPDGDDVLLPEGESDFLTAVFHKQPAIGLPGAANWDEKRDAKFFEKVKRVFVADEQDTGAVGIEKWLSKSSIKGKAYRLRLDGFKDLNEMHCADPNLFLARLEQAKANAQLWIGPEWQPTPEAAPGAGPKAGTDENVERTGFKLLEDGRIIEQIASGFAVYNPATREVTYCGLVEFNGMKYIPLVVDRAVKLADRAEPYVSEAQLNRDIEAYIHRNVDLPDRDRKIAVQYAKLSYITDRFEELCYLRPIGDSGAGKSRFLNTVGNICYRPLMVITPSPASVYRTIDKYHPTLGLDEFNPKDGGEDASEIIRLLNGGFMRGTYVARMEKGANGELENRYFDVYGPKIISSLKPLDSLAFESRCIPTEMVESKRNDIQYRVSRELRQEQAELRNKLLLWRLHNCTRDMEQSLNDAEAFLRQSCYNIRPRHVQIATSLLALISDEPLKNDFAVSLQTRTASDRAEKRESLDGQLATVIHEMLFTKDENTKALVLKDSSEEDKPCESLPVHEIVTEINKGLSEKRQHDPGWVGKQLRRLGLQTDKLLQRQSKQYEKRCIIYNLSSLNKLFVRFALAVPAEFTVSTVISAVTSDTKQDNVVTGDFARFGAVSSLTDSQQTTSGSADSDDRKIMASKEGSLFAGTFFDKPMVTLEERRVLREAGYADSDIALIPGAELPGLVRDGEKLLSEKYGAKVVPLVRSIDGQDIGGYLDYLAARQINQNAAEAG